jgi:IrrE N-terminal-like domain
VWLYHSEQGVISTFWDLCGETEPFPRSLERYLALALPLTVIKLPRLKITDIQDWLSRRGASVAFGCSDRQLRGCLVARGGEGLIFVDGTDSPAELRFTIAHELAHFLIDYLLPRSLALRTFGPWAKDVIDGVRLPTPSERLQALLASKAITVHINLMERSGEGEADSSVLTIENRADRVGLALLAPPSIVLSRLDPMADGFVERHEAVTSELCLRYGLPSWLARQYGRALLVDIDRGPSWVEGIKKT